MSADIKPVNRRKSRLFRLVGFILALPSAGYSQSHDFRLRRCEIFFSRATADVGDWEKKASQRIVRSVLEMTYPLKIDQSLEMTLMNRRQTSNQQVDELGRIHVSIFGTTRRRRDRALTNPAIAHEAAHLVLLSYLKERFDKNPAIQKALREDSTPSKIAANNAKISELRERRGAIWESHQEDLEEFTRLAKEIDDEWERLRKEIVSLSDSRPIAHYSQIPFSTAYDELFADLVAVAHTENLESISQLLIHDPLRPLEPDSPRVVGRSFAKYIDKETWNNSDRHILLAPARSFLGAYLRKNPERRASKLVNDVAEVIGDELLSMVKKPDKGKSLSVSERNKSLIEALFIKLGPPPG